MYCVHYECSTHLNLRANRQKSDVMVVSAFMEILKCRVYYLNKVHKTTERVDRPHMLNIDETVIYIESAKSARALY